MTNGKCQIHLADPRAFWLKNSKKSEKGRNMQEGPGRCFGEFCLFRPFPHVPPSPLSNYNQIKDRVFVARHHWRV